MKPILLATLILIATSYGCGPTTNHSTSAQLAIADQMSRDYDVKLNSKTDDAGLGETSNSEPSIPLDRKKNSDSKPKLKHVKVITEKPPLPTYNPPVTLVTVGQALADPFYFENQLFEGLSELFSLMMQKSDAPTSNSFTPANGWPLPMSEPRTPKNDMLNSALDQTEVDVEVE